MIKGLKMPKVQMSLALIVISISGLGALPSDQYFTVFFISIASCVFFDLFISYLRIKKLFVPYAALVTGLIIALVVDPNLSWYQISIISFTSMAIKNFVRIKNKHIFNPAASGLIAGGLIFGSYVSWWGASFQYFNNFSLAALILYCILLFPLYVSAYKLKRYYSMLSFLIVHGILNFINFGFSFNTALAIFFDPTIIFFSIVMLPEPMTSPSEIKKQIIFGVTVAFLSFIISLNLTSKIFIPDTLLTALLVSNLLFFKK